MKEERNEMHPHQDLDVNCINGSIRFSQSLGSKYEKIALLCL